MTVIGMLLSEYNSSCLFIIQRNFFILVSHASWNESTHGNFSDRILGKTGWRG